MKMTSGKRVPMKLALLAMRSMSWAPQPGILKFDDEAQTFGSKLKLRIVPGLSLICFLYSSTQKEDEIEEYLRKKYADESIAKRHFGDGGEEMSDEITQQTLLPGIK